jgi:NADPH:quinone reductase-like Zn-dependent oxidoreductase
LRDKSQIQFGHKVLIISASGGVGTFAVQIARSFGAEVTGVCSPRNLEMVQSIGADHVIDYTYEDFAESDQRYDLILDIVGNRSLRDYKRVMELGAIYVAVGGPSSSMGFMTRMSRMMLISLFGRHKMTPMLAQQTPEDLNVLQELLGSRAVTPVIDKRYELNEVPEALRVQGEGHAQGKSVIVL